MSVKEYPPVQPTFARDTVVPALLLFLFVSGAAALVFQVLWIKQVSLIVGIDVYAVTTAISAFFAGLALGGALFGRLADTVERPLFLYGILELGIGLSGAGTTIALAHSSSLFVLLSQRVGILAWLLPFILIGIPAVLMGGTLPVVARARTSSGQIARAAGGLYAANTAGAITGALLVPFVLIPFLGVSGGGFAAAGLNGAISVAAIVLSRRVKAESASDLSGKPDDAHRNARLALLLYTVGGGIALGYEVVWSQVIVQFTSTRTFSFAIVLATYLAGLATGSALYVRWRHRLKDAWSVFALLIATAGLLALFEIACLGDWLVHLQAQAGALVRAAGGPELLAMCARFFVAAAGIVFLPTLLLGAAFPATLRLVSRRTRTGRDVGAVVALNTAGGVTGTLATGFLLVPTLGLVRSLGALAIAATAVGVIAAVFGPAVRQRVAWISLAMAGCAVLTVAITPQDQVIRLLTKLHSGHLIFFEEDSGGAVAVVEQRTRGASFRRLYIDGVSNSGDPMPSLRYMRLQSLLPLLIHRGEPRSALVIGFGTGITTGALLQFRGLDQRVCAELLPGVLHAGSLFQGNLGAASDRRIQIRLRDGRQELLRNDQQYDLITLEPPPPSAAGVVNLYSSDFYRLARNRLRPDGIMAQWWPLATQNDEDSRSLVRSFLDVFPNVMLWTTEIHETLLIGSMQPLELDVPRIVARFNQAGVSTALIEVGISTPAALLATWVTGRKGLEQYANGAPPVTDNRPGIEYATWVRRGEFVRVLPQVLALRTDPPLLGADQAFRTAVDQVRGRLFEFYAAALYAYQGDRESWARSLRRVLQEEGDNPYFRWIIGDSRE